MFSSSNNFTINFNCISKIVVFFGSSEVLMYSLIFSCSFQYSSNSITDVSSLSYSSFFFSFLLNISSLITIFSTFFMILVNKKRVGFHLLLKYFILLVLLVFQQNQEKPFYKFYLGILRPRP
ncbi:hypothetical protein [Listeria phage LP-HM00113468]|uniref:Transmembrane protein n=1 Tax=Listeria phage LP-HM00113468 TaxID=2744802 RepID=A0A7D4XMA0_9CAUD|nr:hypothetical protein H2675_gp49 [Listeria phage LP-HM00113468]QKW95470.1 hypothetical protein [Listeria phage LP-HM00113468]